MTYGGKVSGAATDGPMETVARRRCAINIAPIRQSMSSTMVRST